MTDVKRLLADATPLPWAVGKSVHHDGHNLWQAETQGDISSPDAHLSLADARLIVTAVNRLPDYEAAVDALARMTFDFSAAQWSSNLSQRKALEQASVILARLRGAK